MANWFETVVPDNYMCDNVKPIKEKFSTEGTLDVASYLEAVLSDPMSSKFDNDNFTATVNVKNGRIPSNRDYTGFSIKIQGQVNGKCVDKTVLYTDYHKDTVWVWTVKELIFVDVEHGIFDTSNNTAIDAGDDYIMRIKTVNDADNPYSAPWIFTPRYWADNAEFNPKITSAALESIKEALKREQGFDHL